MSLSSFLKKNLMKKKVPRMIFDGISINRGKLRKNSRLGFLSTKKKSTTQNFCLHSIFTTRKNNKARARGCSCVCVCVCRFRE